MKKFKDYKRFPIILGQHSVIVVHVFKRTDTLEDVIWNQNGLMMLKCIKEQLINLLIN